MILVTTHENADFDCAAGMLAVRLLHPGAVLTFPGAKSPALRRYLESEPGLLADVRARDVNLDLVSRLIVVDTCSPQRIGRFASLLDPPGRVPVLCYDHHPGSAPPAGAEVHRIHSGAVTSGLLVLLKSAGIRPDRREATLLALGIYEDTGGFLHAGTSPSDLEAASWVVEQGADLTTVARWFSRDLSPDQVELYHDLLHHTRGLRIAAREVSVAALSTPRYVPDASVVVEQYVRATATRRMAALLRMADCVVLILRSRAGDFDASRIAASFGGGGHPAAASAVIRRKTLIEAEAELLEILRRELSPGTRVGDLATRHLFTVDGEATVEQALGLLNRYRVNALPVLDGATVIGAVTRQTVDVALHHGMGGRPVRTIATGPVTVLPPDADLEGVRDRLLSGASRFLLVGPPSGPPTGIVTRTAFMRFLQAESDPTTSPVRGFGEGDEVPGEDLSGLLRKRLKPEDCSRLERLGLLADSLEFRAFLVGGVVRDLLLGRESRDLDVVVEGDACALARAAATPEGAKVRVHEAFQTAALVFEGGGRIDLATARTEHYRKPAALPDVSPGGIRQDLFRRDFTINTLAVRLTRPGFGRLLDFFGARRDLREGKIRVLHGLSFVEDPTRAFRAVRFAARLDFEISRETGRLISLAVRQGVFQKLSPLRLRRELEAVLGGPRARRAVEMLQHLELLQALHPSLRPGRKSYAALDRAEEILGWRRILLGEDGISGWLVPLAILLDSLAEGPRAEMLDRLQLPRGQADLLGRSPEALRRVITRLGARRNPPPSVIFEVCHAEREEILLLAMAVTGREDVRRSIGVFLTQLRNVRADIGGREVLAAGVEPGPPVAEGLRAALRAKLDGRAPGRQEQLEEALRVARALDSHRPTRS